MITRRQIVLTIGAGAFAAALPAYAQQPPQKMFRVGLLSALGRTPDGAPPALLRDSLRGLGYVEGKNIAYEARFAEANATRLPGLAEELVRLKVDVIVTQGGPATVAAKRATSTIPIVIATPAGDVVVTGIVASLARPGGNVTGLSDESIQLSAKRMQLLKEAVPAAKRLAILWNADDDGMTLRYQEIQKAARVLGVAIQPLGVREPSDFDGAFSEMTRQRPDALFLVADALTGLNRKRVLDFATAHRLPAMYELDFLVKEGGLMSYGPGLRDSFRTAATYVDKILKGTKPGDLPVQNPTQYYLTINLKTAKALGLSIPQSLLISADEVIE